MVVVQVVNDKVILRIESLVPDENEIGGHGHLNHRMRCIVALRMLFGRCLRA